VLPGALDLFGVLTCNRSYRHDPRARDFPADRPQPSERDAIKLPSTVGISNHRLVSFDEHGVCFRTKNGKQVTVAPAEFIRRFLLHVLPNGFVKIRHYGLLASGNVRTKLAEARRHLEVNDESAPASPPQPTWKDRLLALTGIDLVTCPHCGGQMVSHSLATRPSHTAPAGPSPSPTLMDTS
jgi:hypothetical protein